MEAAILRSHPAVLGSIPKHIYTFFNLKCDEKKEEINKTRPEQVRSSRLGYNSNTAFIIGTYSWFPFNCNVNISFTVQGNRPIGASERVLSDALVLHEVLLGDVADSKLHVDLVAAVHNQSLVLGI